MTAALWWRCLICPEHGRTTGTESGADAKHVRAARHATLAASREWAAGAGEAG